MAAADEPEHVNGVHGINGSSTNVTSNGVSSTSVLNGKVCPSTGLPCACGNGVSDAAVPDIHIMGAAGSGGCAAVGGGGCAAAGSGGCASGGGCCSDVSTKEAATTDLDAVVDVCKPKPPVAEPIFPSELKTQAPAPLYIPGTSLAVPSLPGCMGV